MSATAIVGRKSEMAEADDRAKAMVVPFRGLFYAGAIWVNPDDEDSQPLVCMMGPFGSEREAERNSAADVANGRITPAEGRRVAAEGRKALKAAEAALKIGQMFAKRGPRT